MSTLIPKIARSIHYCLWDSAYDELVDGVSYVRVYKNKTESGTWLYTIERIDGKVYCITRYNGNLIEKSPYYRHSTSVSK